MAKFNSVVEQLKRRDARVVFGTCQAMRGAAFKRWKVIWGCW
jgi:hypothetical protein